MSCYILIVLLIVCTLHSFPTTRPSSKEVGFPKCGNSDIKGIQHSRQKRFALEGSRWNKNMLTYFIYEYPSNPATLKLLDRKDIDLLLKQAFAMWSDVASIDFRRVNKKSGERADIRIGWETGDHGDGMPFDGKCQDCSEGDTVAHGFYPIKGGDLHFDDDDTFGKKNVKSEGEEDRFKVKWDMIWQVLEGVEDLFEVAVHEIGHVLGLEHSQEEDSFMWPRVHTSWQSRHNLSVDDVTAIQSLYGTRDNWMQGRVWGDICQVTRFDAVFASNTGFKEFFKDNQVWMVESESSWFKTHTLGVDIFTNNTVPISVDAATEVKTGDTWFIYLFHGDSVFEYTSQLDWNLSSGFPKNLSQTYQFKIFPSNIDGAFSLDGDIYFVKNGIFGLGEYSNQHSFPQPVPVSPPFDDVFVSKDVLYLLKGDFAYFYADKTNKKPLHFHTVADIINVKNFQSGHLNIKTEWFGCPEVP